MTTHNAGQFATPLPPMAQRWSATYEAALKRARMGDRYFTWLCFVLMGYALGGRGFAYWGVNPLFVGEITLLIGVFVIIKSNVLGRVLKIRSFIPLLLFMIWGMICTVPYLDTYQKDAIRDGVIWGYGTYAFIVATLLISDPTRVQKMVMNYRRFVVWFLVLGPVISIIMSFFEAQIPTFPGSGVPIIQVKGGDFCVHLSGVFAYIVALGKGLDPWLISIFMPINLGLNVQGRAGMVAFAVAIFVTSVLRPFHPRAMRIYFVLAVGLFFFWASDLRIEKGARELSFNGLMKGFGSIVGESDDAHLDGTKEWRIKWWTDIINYTVNGKYFWMGKGFGINLATDDGYQVEAEETLRSPHNGHLTMLARSGVPGFSLWVILQGVFGLTIVRAYIRAKKNKHLNWSGLFMWLGAYWGAFMANATFDVFLEGPMGGIWMYSIYGAGIASAYIYRYCPELLTPQNPSGVPMQAQPVSEQTVATA